MAWFAVPAIGAALGFGAGKAASGITLPGINNRTYEPYKVDPTAGYGRGDGYWEVKRDEKGVPIKDANGNTIPERYVPGPGDVAAAKYNIVSDQAAGRANELYGQAAQDRGMGLEARGQAAGIADLMAARARGQVPSIAGMQAARDMGRLAAEQSSIAASARGPGALALASQNQAFGTAQGMGNISQNAQIAAAQERQAAEQAAYGAYAGLRQGDTQSQGLGYQAAGQNQQQQLGYSQLENTVRTTQGQNALAREALSAQSYDSSQGANRATAQSNADTYKQYAMGALKSAAGVAGGGGGGDTSDANAKMGVMDFGGGLGGNELTGGGGEGGGSGSGGLDFLNFGGGGGNAYADPNPSYVTTPGGGVNVMATWEKMRHVRSGFGPGGAHSDVMSKQNVNPVYSDIYSDTRAKQDAREMGQAEGMMAGMRANLARPPSVQAALDRSAGPDQTMGRGQMMTAALAEGAKPYSYEYRPGMGPPGPNVGPMAQDMLQNPITATAIQRNPETGLLALDRDRSMKLALGGVGHLAQQQRMTDEQARAANAKADALIAALRGGSRAADMQMGGR